MPTITTVDVAWLPSPTSYTDAEHRRFDTAMFLGDGSANGVRGGISRHGDNSLAVTVNGSDQVTVQPGACVIPGATGLGVYRGALAAATSATAIDARNATNPRIDLVVFRATGAVDIITGTPGASPSAPALPAQSVELARLSVPAVGGGAVTVDSSWRVYATAIGGTMVVETAARLPGSGLYKGQRAIALDTGRTHLWNGTAWEIPGGWQAWTPTQTGFTVATGFQAFYSVYDKTVTANYIGTIATVTAGVDFSVSLPVPVARNPIGLMVIGQAHGLDVGVSRQSGQALLNTDGTLRFSTSGTGALWSSAVPMTWNNGDQLSFAITYERS